MPVTPDSETSSLSSRAHPMFVGERSMSASAVSVREETLVDGVADPSLEKLNHAIHMAAVTQVRNDTPGRTYYLRKQAEGKSRKETLRASVPARV